MKNLTILFLLFILAVSAQAQYNTDNLSITEEFTEVDLYTFKNLRLYPIYANEVFFKAHEMVGDYLTLKEALETKKVIVTEVQSDDQIINNQQDNKAFIHRFGGDAGSSTKYRWFCKHTLYRKSIR